MPLDEVAKDNPICVDLAQSEYSSVMYGLHGQMAQVQLVMCRGIVYRFPYHSRTPVADLREMTKLKKMLECFNDAHEKRS